MKIETESEVDGAANKASLRLVGPDAGVALGGGREKSEIGLRPALFAGYRDLSRLRHDYPLILVEGAPGTASVESLSATIDEILRAIAPKGPGGEKSRRHVLGLEDRIRALVAGGAAGLLSAVWDRAEADFLAETDEAARAALGDSLKRARGVLHVDGQVLDCGEASSARLLKHVWNAVQAAKAKAFREKIDRLIRRLSDILHVDFMKSGEARRPEVLKAAVGTAYEAAFDFATMSGILARDAARDRLPEDRRRRIQAALATLESQRFYARGRTDPYVFAFDSVAAASEAWRDRLPALVEVVKAMAVADLEIENRYRVSVHDPFFVRFGADMLRPEELALFPSYLVCLRDGGHDLAETGRMLEILGTDLPIKLLLQTDDILADLPLRPGRPSFAGGGSLAAMAVGLSGVYVLQAPASHLCRARDRLVKGLAYEGPALFSVFSGATKGAAGVPPYLVAAAALESRAFPMFVYDPAAGPDLASRLNIDGNPQVDADWPVHRLAYEDENHQRVAEDAAFTFVDFAACDARHAARCESVPRAKNRQDMVAIREYLTREDDGNPEGTPYVFMVNGANGLRRVAVDDALVQAARRCRSMWRNLQELGGINSSHARRLLDRERQAWEEEKKQTLTALRERAEVAPLPPATAEPAAASAKTAAASGAEKAVASPDEPYIETPRCTTCNECIQINGRMFAYDENKQAYIKDIKAGTYRDLVESAESCQVSIIHPGKPWDPAEANLDELIERAKSFN